MSIHTFLSCLIGISGLGLVGCSGPTQRVARSLPLALMGVEVPGHDGPQRGGPRIAVPAPGEFAVLVDIKSPAYVYLVRKSRAGESVLFSAKYSPADAPGDALRVPINNWVKLGDMEDEEQLCIAALDDLPRKGQGLCGETSTSLLWGRGKGETYTEHPKSPPPPPPPPPPSPSK